MKKTFVVRSILVATLSIGMMAVAAAPSQADNVTTHIYLNYSTTSGEAVDADHPKWIEINSFKWGASKPLNANADSSGNRLGTKVTLDVVTLSKKVDASTTGLLNELFAGAGTATATIEFVSRPKGATKDMVYLRYTLTGVQPSDYSLAGGDTGSLVETINLYLSKVSIDYIEMTPGTTGVVIKPKKTVGFDVLRNATL